MLFRIWPGTQRMLLWGDPEIAAAYGRASQFCGARDGNLRAAVFQRPRRAPAQPGGRCGYADASLDPAAAIGKSTPIPIACGAACCTIRKPIRTSGGDTCAGRSAPAAGPVEDALAHASRVLPLLTTSHLPSASNRGYWVEVPANMPIAEGGAPVPYGDTPTPKRFGTVSRSIRRCSPPLKSMPPSS